MESEKSETKQPRRLIGYNQKEHELNSCNYEIKYSWKENN